MGGTSHHLHGDHFYVVALGSNRPLSARLSPRAILRAAADALDDGRNRVMAVSPILTTAPIGPSRRRYANGAVLLSSPLPPERLLAHIHVIERRLGRRRARRWGERTLDIDILCWSGGRWSSRDLTIPHPALRHRAFALRPLMALAPQWRDPLTGLRPVHLIARLEKSLDAGAGDG